MHPLVTIITVCRNPGLSICRTFESVIAQNYLHIEYIIIDGISSDGTLEYLNKSEQRKHISLLLSESDSGIYDAINKGISFANGEIICILHAGDTFYNNNAIDLVVNEFKNSQKKLDVLCGGICFVNYNERNEDPLYPLINSVSNLRYRMSLFHPSVFISSEAYLKYGVYDSSYKIAGDFELLRRYYLANANIDTTQICFVSMEYGGVSTQLKNVSLIAHECAIIIYGNKPSIKKCIYFLLHVILTALGILKKRIINLIKSFDNEKL